MLEFNLLIGKLFRSVQIDGPKKFHVHNLIETFDILNLLLDCTVNFRSAQREVIYFLVGQVLLLN